MILNYSNNEDLKKRAKHEVPIQVSRSESDNQELNSENSTDEPVISENEEEKEKRLLQDTV